MSIAPEICGFYSITEDDRYEETLSSLRYFAEPKLPIDLNIGIDKLNSKPPLFENMGHILRFILNHKELLNKHVSMQSDGKLIPSTQYITYKGILRLIMCSNLSPYPWTIIAIKYKGNIYLCECRSQEEEQKKQNIKPRLKRIFKYRSMYKHHCLSEHPNKTPDISHTGDKFFCVLKRNLVNRQFLMATQMDGTDSRTPLDREWKPNQFIGLTMTCELNTQNKQKKFERFKISDIWASSFLAGIERFHIGFRNDFGIFTDSKCYSIDELEAISKRNWKGSLDGLGFLDYFLSMVETDLEDIDCPYTCMKYHFDEKTKFISTTKHEGKTEYSLIPDWYLEEINKETNLD